MLKGKVANQQAGLFATSGIREGVRRFPQRFIIPVLLLRCKGGDICGGVHG